MPDGKPNDGLEKRRLGLSLTLSQVGLEMVAPIGLGVWLDQLLGWQPWLTISGVVLGFVGGMTHLVLLANRLNRDDSPPGPGQGKA